MRIHLKKNKIFFIYNALNADINNVIQIIILKIALFQSLVLLLLAKKKNFHVNSRYQMSRAA
jgi:hypothetical protein